LEVSVGSVIGIIIFFWILSAILKKSGARERISRKDSVNIGKIIGLIALSACGLLPIFLVIWAFSAASKDAKNNKNGQVNRNMYSNRPTEVFAARIPSAEVPGRHRTGRP
jgi:hypothetical protein